MDAQTRDRVLALAGVEARAEPGQRYHHWWIPTAEFDKVTGFLKDKFGNVSTETDWKGVHFTIATKGDPVKFTVSALDLAGFGLALLSGPIGTAAEAALIAGRVQKAARLARAAKAASVAGKAIAVGGAVSKVSRSDILDGEIRDRLLRVAGVEVRDRPPVDVAVEALVAAVRHLVDGETRAWSAAEAAKHPRVKGGPRGGEFKSVFDRMVDALTTWSRGEGPADPFEGQFTREQMRETAKTLGLNPRPRIPEKELKNLLFAHIRANVQHPVDRPRASFTLKGPDHRDLDVGVYVENKAGSKIFLRRESNGKPGSILQSFDDLGGLHAWASEHGETDLADWARSEQAPSRAPVKRVPAEDRPLGSQIHPAMAQLIKTGRPPLPGQLASPLSVGTPQPSTASVQDVAEGLGFDLDWVPKSGPRDFGDYREHIASHDASMLAAVQAAMGGEAEPALGVHRPGASYAAIGRGLEKWANGSVGPYYNAAVAGQGAGARPDAAAAYREQGDRWIALANKLQEMRREPGASRTPTPRTPQAGRAPRQPRAARDPGAGLSPVPAATVARITTGLDSARSSDDARRVIDAEKLTKGQLRQLAADLDIPLVGGSTAAQIRDDIVKVKVAGRLTTAVIHKALAPAAIPPAEQAARDRQVKVDRASSVHALVSEVDQLLTDGASDRALKARITSGSKVSNTPPDVRDRLLAAVGDEPAMRQVLADIRREEGLSPIGEAGDVVPFDPEKHRSIGEPLDRGATVTVVRPGHRFERDGLGPDHDGIEGVTFPAVVEKGVPRPSLAPWSTAAPGLTSPAPAGPNLRTKAGKREFLVALMDDVIAQGEAFDGEAARMFTERFGGRGSPRDVFAGIRDRARAGEDEFDDIVPDLMGRMATAWQLPGQNEDGLYVPTHTKRFEGFDEYVEGKKKILDLVHQISAALSSGELRPPKQQGASPFDFSHAGLTARIDGNPSVDPDGVTRVSGQIRDATGSVVGSFGYHLDPAGHAMHVDSVAIAPEHQGNGFGSAFAAHVEDALRQQGYTRATVEATHGGGYAWARAGYGWDSTRPDAYGDVPARIITRLRSASGADEAALRGWLDRFDSDDRSRWPSPQEIAASGALGREILTGSSWRGEKALGPTRENSEISSLAAGLDLSADQGIVDDVSADLDRGRPREDIARDVRVEADRLRGRAAARGDAGSPAAQREKARSDALFAFARRLEGQPDQPESRPSAPSVPTKATRRPAKKAASAAGFASLSEGLGFDATDGTVAEAGQRLERGESPRSVAAMLRDRADAAAGHASIRYGDYVGGGSPNPRTPEQAAERQRLRDEGMDRARRLRELADQVEASQTRRAPAKKAVSKATPPKVATSTTTTTTALIDAGDDTSAISSILAPLRAMDSEARRDALDLRLKSDLQALLRSMRLPVSGTKRELVDRLVNGLEVSVTRSTDLDLDDLEDDLDLDEADEDEDLELEEVADEDPARSLDPEVRARVLALAGVETRMAGKDVTPGHDKLHHYWTKNPEGLAKWIKSPHQWTALYRHLVKYVNPEMAKRMASEWLHEVTGEWAGSDIHRVHSGKPPRGHRIGPG